MTLALEQAMVIGSDPMPTISGNAILAVIITIGLLAGLAWFLRKTAATRRSGQLVTVETAVSLGERRSLVIVAVEGRRLLLGLTPGAVSLVTELQAPGLKPQAFSTALDHAQSRDGVL